MAASTLDVEYLFTITVQTGDRTNALVPNGPAGTRAVVAVTGGTFDGPKLKGTVVAPGGDWVSVRENRVVKLDVRVLLVTDDGESILMTYNGIGTPGEDGGTSLRTAPTFEAGPGAYAWLNDVQAVGIGHSSGQTVSYEIYALA